MKSIYTIYDVCTSEYGVPFVAINDDDCKRLVAVNMINNPYHRDLKLFRVGDFNVDTGVITPCSPVFMANVTDLIKVVHDEP